MPAERIGRPDQIDAFAARLGALAVLALAVRLLYITVIAPAPIGLDGDWRFYHSAANLIAHGHFYYRGIFGRAYVTAEHPPLYPLVLAPVAALGGVHVLAQRVVGCVIGTVSVVLIGRLGRRLGGEGAGLAAAAIMAVYPPLVVIDGSLVSEPLLVLGLIVGLLGADRLIGQPNRPGAGGLGASAGLGVVVGLTGLAHPVGLLLLPLLVWPAGFAARRGQAVRMVLASTVAAGLVLAPWVIRNAVVFHRLTFATNSNTLIAGANCPETYYGRDLGWWRLDCDARGRTFTQLVQGDANTAPALHYARSHLARLPVVAAVRVLRTFSLYQPLREGAGQRRRRWFDVLGLVIYYPIALLAGLALWRRPARRWLLLGPIGLTLLVSATGWGIVRFRAPADISLILLAAMALRVRETAGS
ncbi:MAG: glycosyltransferase family 39 protein [Actinomycetota bacterium]|nr:glycosyltransferase family 39 protein [Actinomycetota bacterium]